MKCHLNASSQLLYYILIFFIIYWLMREVQTFWHKNLNMIIHEWYCSKYNNTMHCWRMFFRGCLVLSKKKTKKKKKKRRRTNAIHCHLSCGGIKINVPDTLQTVMLMQREIRVTQNRIGVCQPEHRSQTLMANCILLLLWLFIFIVPNIPENKIKLLGTLVF